MSKLCEAIKNIHDLRHIKGCSNVQLSDAEKALQLEFSKEYAEYTTMFGAITFYGTEWTGLNIDGRLNVVDATQQERSMHQDFPRDCYVIENIGVDGIIVISDKDGHIYQFHHGEKRCVHKSLYEYLRECIAREEG